MATEEVTFLPSEQTVEIEPDPNAGKKEKSAPGEKPQTEAKTQHLREKKDDATPERNSTTETKGVPDETK